MLVESEDEQLEKHTLSPVLRLAVVVQRSAVAERGAAPWGTPRPLPTRSGRRSSPLPEEGMLLLLVLPLFQPAAS